MSELQQRTPEWHQVRSQRVTASEAGALLGLSPHTSEQDAFRRLVRKMNGMESEFVSNVAVEYGNFHESGALAEYQMETGHKVEEIGFIEFQDWLGASPDGLIGSDKGLEIKCPFSMRDKNPPEFKALEDQPHYYAQVQINLFCSKRDTWDFYQWSTHGTSLDVIKYDGAWIGENIPKLKEIHERAKAANPSDYEGPKRPVFDTPEAVRLVNEYDELSEAIDNATDRKKDILKRMVELSGKKNAVIAGRNLTLVQRSGSVSYAQVVKEYAPDVDLEPFRGKPSESWQLK